MPDMTALMQSLPVIAIALAFGYLLGSIPFGVLITRIAGAGDVRQIGSGNIGATNVLRTGRKGLAAATLIGDALKGTIAVLIANQFSLDAAVAAGFAAFIGHLYPVWLGFKGGKGVATYLGVLFGLAWPAALGFIAIWLCVAFITRFSSLAALIAAGATPLVLWALQFNQASSIYVLLSLILIVKHHENIKRLIAGTESRIGQKSAPEPDATSDKNAGVVGNNDE
jgi:glycerol-3-phosphate acyltransferase PlsY